MGGGVGGIFSHNLHYCLIGILLVNCLIVFVAVIDQLIWARMAAMPFSSKGALVHDMIRIRLGLGACYACIPKRFNSTWSLHHHMADPSNLTGLSPLIHQSYVLMVAFSSMAGATGGQSIQKSYNAMIGQRQLLPYRKGHKGCSVRGKRHARGVCNIHPQRGTHPSTLHQDKAMHIYQIRPVKAFFCSITMQVSMERHPSLYAIFNCRDQHTTYAPSTNVV